MCKYGPYTFCILLFGTFTDLCFLVLQSMVESIKHCIVLLQIAKVNTLPACFVPPLWFSCIIWSRSCFLRCYMHTVCNFGGLGGSSRLTVATRLSEWGGCSPVFVSSHVPFTFLKGSGAIIHVIIRCDFFCFLNYKH